MAGKGTAASSSYLTITSAKVDSFSPKLAAAGGMTLLSLSGKGYDGGACDRNVVEVDGVQCAVLSCSGSSLTALFPGGWRSHSASLGTLLQVLQHVLLQVLLANGPSGIKGPVCGAGDGDGAQGQLMVMAGQQGPGLQARRTDCSSGAAVVQQLGTCIGTTAQAC